MNWSSIGLLIAVIFPGCSVKKEDTKAEIKVHSSHHLIEVHELVEIIENDTIKIIDMRQPDAYQLGHLPNAIHIGREDIQDNNLPYAGKIASKEQLEQLFSANGIRTSDFLVIYDDKSSCEAARLWWVLDYYGFDQMAILHGGIKAWKRVQPVTNTTKTSTKSNFTFKQSIKRDRFIDVAELKMLIEDENIIVLDTRSEKEFRGGYEKKGAFASGRIPQSVNMDWLQAMKKEEQTFKSVTQLASIYQQVGINGDEPIITYCHSGVRSAHTLFVLTELLGYKNVRNYDGSWVEWSYHQLPLERDSLILN